MKGVAKAYLVTAMLVLSTVSLGLGGDGLVGSAEAQINPFDEVDDLLEDVELGNDGECEGNTDGTPVENQTANATDFLTNDDPDCGINDEGDDDPTSDDCETSMFNASECAEYQVGEGVTNTINTTEVGPVNVMDTLNSTIVAVLCTADLGFIVDTLNNSINVGCPEPITVLPEGGEVVFTGLASQSGDAFDVNVTEGWTATFNVSLSEQPVGVVNVTFTAGSHTALSTTGNAGDAVSAVSLLFTPLETGNPGSYQDAQTVHVHGIQDNADDQNETDTITWSSSEEPYNSTMQDSQYDGLIGTLDVFVEDDDHPPVLDAIGDKSVAVGQALDFTVAATDPDAGDTLTFALDSNAAGATVEPSSGAFSWTPTATDVDTYYANFSVTDQGDLSDWENITITVNERTTSLESNATSGLAPLDVTFWANVTDPALVLSDPDSSVNATFDDGQGTVTDLEDFNDNQTIMVTYSTPGTYEAWFNGTHDTEGVFSHSIPVTVDNNVPVFVESLSNQTIDEGELLLLRVNATDVEDGAVLTYGIETNTTMHSYVDNTTAGGKDFSWTPGPAANGTYFANFTVDDSDGGMIWKNITIIVQRVNDVPVLDSIGIQSVPEGQTLTFTATASDDDGDDLTFSINDNNVTGATIGPSTGEFSWTPPSGGAGEYYANITVTDDELTDFQNVTITVTELSTSLVSDVTSGPAPLAVAFDVNATNWTKVSGATFDPGNGTGASSVGGNQTIDVLYEVKGTYTAWFNGTYAGEGDYFNHSIPINALNNAPTFTDPIDIDDVTVDEEESVVLWVNATDLDGDALTHTNQTNVTGGFSSSDTADGKKYTWTPGPAANGTYWANFTVDDEDGGVIWKNITIIVQRVNDAPVLDAISDPQSIVEGQTLAFQVNASDDDGDDLTFGPLTDGKTNITGHSYVNNATAGGMDFSWTPGSDDVGEYYANFTVTDGADTVFQNVTIMVTADDTAPGVVTGLGVTPEGHDLNVTWTAPADLDIDHFNVYYHTAAFNVTDGTASVQATVDGSLDFLVLTGLTPDTEYFVNVTAVDGSSNANEGFPVEPGVSTTTAVNQVPAFDGDITNETVATGHELAFTITATDDDGDVLSFSLDTNATGATIGADTGMFSWTPGPDDAGEYYANFTVSDGHGGSAWDNITITVTADVTAPGLVTSLDAVTEGHTRINVSWVPPTDMDVDHFKVHYHTAAFNVTGGTASVQNTTDGSSDFVVLTGLTPNTKYFVNVTAVDLSGNEGPPIEPGVSNTTDPNTPPVLDAIGNRSVEEGKELSFTVNATDADDDSLIISSFQSNATGHAFTFNTSTSKDFKWTPGPADNGTYYVNFTVIDLRDFKALGGKDFENVTITVEKVNDPPVLDGIGTKSVMEGHNLSFAVTASDLDGDDLMFDSLEGRTNVTGFSYAANTTTGGQDFSWTPDKEDNGTYYVNFTVSDGDGGSDWKNVTIHVIDNALPTLEVIGDRVIVEGDEVDLEVEASDPEGQELQITVVTDMEGHFFGTEDGFAEFEWIAGFDDAGTYYANFSVFDGSFTVHENVTITVTPNTAPVLGAVGAKSLSEGDTLAFNVTASDPDGPHPLVFDIESDLPTEDANAPGFDAGTGEFTWTATSGDAGTYYANFSVTDGDLTDFENITITVFGNRAPVLDEIGDRFVEVEDTLFFRVNASDADGDALTFGALTVESGTTNVTGHFYNESILGGMNFSWTPTTSQVGTYYANFTVTDGDGLSDFERITITVRPSIAPVLQSIGDFSVEAEDVLQMNLIVVDPGDEDGLEFDLETDAPHASLHSSTGRFTFAPEEGDEGTYYANFIVTDDDDLSDFENVTITVTPYTPDPVTFDSGEIKRAATLVERQSLVDAGLGIDLDEEVLFVDLDGDGDQDAIETASGTIETAHDVDSLDILVLVDTETDAMAVMDFGAGSASPVQQIAEGDTAVEVQDTKRREDEKVAVTVPKEDGWIHVAIDDPAPDQNITSLERSDGVTLELDQAWRTSDGRLHLIDDPDTTYTVGFEPVPKESKVWLWILLSVLGALILAGGVWGGIYLYRRWRTDPYHAGLDEADPEEYPPESDDAVRTASAE